MPDKNLTDKEIVKALEDLVKCNNNEIDCGSCSLSVFYPRCPEEIGELSLDLINRLQAENKRLKAPTTDWLVRGVSPEQLEQEKIQVWKAEAYKEFAEKLLDAYEIWTDNDELEYQYVAELVDNLLKELVGEDNA